jgi:hypothetical protein
VKTTGHGGTNAQWSVKEDWATTTLFKGDVRPDFVIFVWFNNREMLDACRIFVVPADVVTGREIIIMKLDAWAIQSRPRRRCGRSPRIGGGSSE